MKYKNTWKKILVILIFAAFAAITAGGMIFYSYQYETTTVNRIIMALQNSMESLLFNPLASVPTILEETGFWSSLSTPEKICMYGYCIAMVLAPLVDLLIVFSVLDDFLHFFVGMKHQKERTLIVGYEKRVKKILDAGFSDNKVYLWTENILSSEEERELFFHKVIVEMHDFSLGDKPDQIAHLKNFIKKKKINSVILLNDSDAKNIEYYMALSSSEICKKRTIHFYILNQEFENRNFLQNYFEQKVEEYKNNGSDHIYTNLDLRIFNLSQLQAEVLFQQLPLHTGLESSTGKHIHLLIIGGGCFGEHLLLHAMNQGVLSSDNQILIDVVDKDISVIKKQLSDRFAPDYVTVHTKEDLFVLSDDYADGNLIIRLTQKDIYASDFADTILHLQSEEMGDAFTYIAVCIPDADSNLHCITTLDQSRLSAEHPIPLALRMSYSAQMEQFIKQLPFCLDVQMLGEDYEYIGLDQIINKQQEQTIRNYNLTYQRIQNSTVFHTVDDQKADPDLLWNRLYYYQRQSNRALFLHRIVKEAFFQNCEQEISDFLSHAALAEQSDTNHMASDLIWSKYLITHKDQYPTLFELAKTEHRRFDYFFASEGWCYGHAKDVRHRVHDCLCTWEVLEDVKTSTIIYDLIASPVLMKKYDA